MSERIVERIIDVREIKRHVRLLKGRFPALDVADITSVVHDAHLEYEDGALQYVVAYRACLKLLRKPKGICITSIDVMHIEDGNLSLHDLLHDNDSKVRLSDNTADFEAILARQPASVRLLADISEEESRKLALAGYAVWDFGAVPMLQGRIRDRFIEEVGCSRETYYAVRKELVKMLQALN